MLITTSRDPSSRLVQFAKELKLVFPNSRRMNRGGLVRWLLTPLRLPLPLPLPPLRSGGGTLAAQLATVAYATSESSDGPPQAVFRHVP